MELNKYQELAMRTRFKDKPIEQEFLYGALGLSGELSEVIECIQDNEISDLNDFKEELGDVMWYTAYMCTLNNLKLEELLYIYTGGQDDSIKDLIVSTGSICDIEKKVYFHEHERDNRKVKVHLARILNCIKLLCNFYLIDFDLILLGNIEKLSYRYPAGFSVEASKNRRK